MSKQGALGTSGEASQTHEEEKSNILGKVMEKVLEDKLLEMDLIRPEEKEPSLHNVPDQELGIPQEEPGISTDPNKSQLSNIEKQLGGEQPSNLIEQVLETKPERPNIPFELAILDDYIVENVRRNFYTLCLIFLVRR